MRQISSLHVSRNIVFPFFRNIPPFVAWIAKDSSRNGGRNGHYKVLADYASAGVSAVDQTFSTCYVYGTVADDNAFAMRAALRVDGVRIDHGDTEGIRSVLSAGLTALIHEFDRFPQMVVRKDELSLVVENRLSQIAGRPRDARVVDKRVYWRSLS
ncbi:MAG TPA: hypothetical protein VJB87_01215 [Candidatus Nanoarchaeia archaeon]|nr:hypothetical protein [Candidatus Nanoarchaeia archaeon]